MVERKVLGDGIVLLSTTQSITRVERLAPGVILCTSVGRSVVTLDDAVMQELDRDVESAKSVFLYCDLRGLSRMDLATREKAVAWGRKHHGKLNVHVLVTSKLVELALSVISMVVGTPVQFYASENAFLAAVQTQVPALRSLPVVPLPTTKQAG
jgi:hypothetical protein